MSEASSITTDPLLDVAELTITFGGLRALDGVSLQVPEGQIVGLIGPNGAGKTTLFNCLSGFLRPNSGSIRFQSRDMLPLSPHRRSLLGVGRTFQNVGLCKEETVAANLIIAQHRSALYPAVPGMFGLGVRTRESALNDRVSELLDLFDLHDHRLDLVRDLPVGLAKLVELACIMSSTPSLLLLDEPSAGLGPEESDRMRDVLLRLNEEQKVGILLIGHDMRLVMNLARSIYVLNFGKILATGTPQEVRDDEAVVAAYLGTEASYRFGAPEGPE